MRRLVLAVALLLAGCGQRSQPARSNVVAGTPPKVAAETAGANSGANATSANNGEA